MINSKNKRFSDEARHQIDKQKSNAFIHKKYNHLKYTMVEKTPIIIVTNPN